MGITHCSICGNEIRNGPTGLRQQYFGHASNCRRFHQGPDISLTDMYGTKWGHLLAEQDKDRIKPTGAATIDIPNGTPDV